MAIALALRTDRPLSTTGQFRPLGLLGLHGVPGVVLPEDDHPALRPTAFNTAGRSCDFRMRAAYLAGLLP